MLSRIALQNGREDLALDLAKRASDLALDGDHRLEWLHCVSQVADACRAHGDADQARDVLQTGLKRAREWRNEGAVGVALASLCRHYAALGQDDAAVENGGAALKLLDDTIERANVLLIVGPALMQLGLLRAAERCFTLVSQRAADPTQRAMAGAGLCGCAAIAGDETRFKERVTLTLRDLPQLARFDRAQVLAHLARASVMLGHTALGREQVRQAIALLGDHGPPAIVRQAESVLHELEQAAASELRATRVPTITDQTRRIASELERAVDTLAPAR
jgi:tetratricopeptide (TPR) repeat protein